MASLRGWVTVMGGALLAAPCALAAQAAVSGQITLLEKPGEYFYDLQSAVVYLVPAVKPKAKLKTEVVTVTMHDREFSPPVTITTVGSSVRFENQDPFTHNAFSNSQSGTFDFGLTDRGMTVNRKLKHSGVYPVFCDIHSKMSAYLVVVPTPYYALAGVDGRFMIAGVRAGTYTLHAWHPRGGEMSRTLKVPASGASGVAVELDARGFQKVAHKHKTGEPYATDSTLKF
jgi:plastocyanin